MPQDDFDLYGEDEYRQPQKTEVCINLRSSNPVTSDDDLVRMLDTKASISKSLRKKLQL